MPEYAATAFKFLLTNQEKSNFFLQQSHICITNEHLYSKFLNEIIYYYPVNHPDQNRPPETELSVQTCKKCLLYLNSSQSMTNLSFRMLIMNTMAECFLVHESDFQREAQISSQVISALNKNVKSTHRIFQIVSSINLFKIFEQFAFVKNKNAPSIYNNLVMHLVQGCTDQSMRQLYLTNF